MQGRRHQPDHRLRGLRRPRQPAPTRRPARQRRRLLHLTLLAKNTTGFKNLIKLASIAFLEGFYYVPRIDKELLEAHSEGLICLSGCLPASSASTSSRDQPKKAQELAEWFAQGVRERLLHRDPEQRPRHPEPVHAGGGIDIAKQLGLPLVATADAHYLCQDDADAHDVLLCINTGKKREPTDETYPEGRMPSQFYVRVAGGDVPALPGLSPRRSSAARRSPTASTSSSTSRSGTSPSSRRPTGKTPEEYLRELCEAGPARALRRRSRSRGDAHRLEHELGIICRMGFAGYFLIVWDFVRFARENGIPCQRPRLRLRRDRQLRPEAEPRRSAGIRLALRALPRPEPQRGARHRHRLLPGPPRGGDRLREAEVRRGERGPDRAPSARWPRRRPSRTSAACSTCRSTASTS